MIHGRRTAQVIVVCLLLALGASCTSRPLEAIPGAPGPASSVEPAGSDGQSYALHMPDGAGPAGGLPLVIALHGLSSGAEQMEALTGFSDLADEEEFAVAYPDAGDGLWLDISDGLFGQAGVASESDVAFIGELIDALVADHGVNPDEVFVSGYSNGALFAVQLACDFPDKIAAIGIVAAAGTTDTLDNCELDSPVGYIAFHGTTDSIIPFDGGTLANGVPGIVEFTGAEEAATLWAEQLECPANPERQPELTDPDFPVLRTTFEPCDSGTAVELYAVEDGGHGWPGGNNDSSSIATTSADIDATSIMWTFFNQHGRRR